MPPNATSAGNGLGEQHPRALGEGRVAGGRSDEIGELPHDRELLVAIEGARVREHLHAHVLGAAVDVGERGDVVDEGRGVLAEHRDVGHLLDRLDDGRRIRGETARVGEGACGRIDVDHRHGGTPQGTRSRI